MEQIHISSGIIKCGGKQSGKTKKINSLIFVRFNSDVIFCKQSRLSF